MAGPLEFVIVLAWDYDRAAFDFQIYPSLGDLGTVLGGASSKILNLPPGGPAQIPKMLLGELLPRLHRLVRADCTTRNRRKAQNLQRTYDELEQRIARIAEQEDLARVRPDLNGNEIMRLLGIPPGSMVGKAWQHLKDLRLDRGPLGRDEAEAELFRWARENGIEARENGIEPPPAD